MSVPLPSTTITMKTSDKADVALEQNRVAGKERGDAHSIQRLPRGRRRQAVAGVVAANGIDVVGRCNSNRNMGKRDKRNRDASQSEYSTSIPSDPPRGDPKTSLPIGRVIMHAFATDGRAIGLARGSLRRMISTIRS